MIAYLKEFWRLLRAWSMQLAALGIVLPDILQLLAQHIDSLPMLDNGHKSLIRLACLIGIVLLRPVKQASLAPASPKGPT